MWISNELTFNRILMSYQLVLNYAMNYHNLRLCTLCFRPCVPLYAVNLDLYLLKC